jgi:hypothetical protein
MWIPIALFALTAPLTSIAPLQEASEPVQQEPLAMHYFTPDEEHLMELYEQARDLFRRGVPRPSGNARDGSADNLFLLGDSIVVYDTAAYADVVLSSLTEMQNAWRKQGIQAEKLPPAKLVAEELRVTNISAYEAYEALEQHLREVRPPDGGGRAVPNVQFLEDRNIVLLRDTLEKVKAMRGLIERIDKPAPQVQLSFLVVHAYPSDGDPPEFDPRVPSALTQALAGMLPTMSLSLESSAFLRTVASDGVQRQVFMPIEASSGRYSVNLKLEAFDERTGTLSLRTCEFSFIDSKPMPQVTPYFSTATSIPIDEYVVIGANGASPTLLVLRAVRVDGGAKRAAKQDLAR